MKNIYIMNFTIFFRIALFIALLLFPVKQLYGTENSVIVSMEMDNLNNKAIFFFFQGINNKRCYRIVLNIDEKSINSCNVLDSSQLSIPEKRRFYLFIQEEHPDANYFVVRNFKDSMKELSDQLYVKIDYRTQILAHDEKSLLFLLPFPAPIGEIVPSEIHGLLFILPWPPPVDTLSEADRSSIINSFKVIYENQVETLKNIKFFISENSPGNLNQDNSKFLFWTYPLGVVELPNWPVIPKETYCAAGTETIYEVLNSISCLLSSGNVRVDLLGFASQEGGEELNIMYSKARVYFWEKLIKKKFSNPQKKLAIHSHCFGDMMHSDGFDFDYNLDGNPYPISLRTLPECNNKKIKPTRNYNRRVEVLISNNMETNGYVKMMLSAKSEKKKNKKGMSKSFLQNRSHIFKIGINCEEMKRIEDFLRQSLD